MGTSPSRLVVSFLAALAIAVAAAGLPAVAAEGEDPTPGGISGTVTGSGGEAVAGVSVLARTESGELATPAPATTGAGGTYTITGLPPGRYRIRFAPGPGSPYVGQYYANQTQWCLADGITLDAGQELTGINAVLLLGASISGTVTGPGGGPAAGVSVTAQGGGETPSSSGQAVTAVDGTYTIAGLADGQYKLLFSPPAGSGATGEYHYDRQDWFAADAVTLVAGEQRAGVDASLAPAATISGTVTDAGGSGVGGVDVSASTQTGAVSSSGVATTAADGTYTITGLAAGAYTVVFQPSPASGYAAAYYPDAGGASAGTVRLAAGDHHRGVNATLQPGAVLAGTVTGPGGEPLAGVSVSASGAPGTVAPSGAATTAADGTYTMAGLAAGTYQVRFDPGFGSAYAGEFYDDEQEWSRADAVTLVAGERRGGIDAALAAAASISGTITVPAGGNAGGVTVTAIGLSGGPSSFGYATSAADGRYTISGLGAGEYRIQFSALPGCGLGYATQWYNARPDWGSADTVTLGSGEQRDGIDATLVAAAGMSGTVTGSVGEPLAGVFVFVSGPAFGFGTTAADGTYTVTGLPAGDYKVQFVPGYGSPYTAEWYDDQPDGDTALVVTLATGEHRPGLDAVLAGGASISGTVTGPAGEALAGVTVTASGVTAAAFASATTGPDGRYHLTGLAGGDYRLRFVLPPGSLYSGEYYDDQADGNRADTLTLAAGEQRAGVNATLAGPASISGTVRGPDGAPLAGASVSALSTSGGMGAVAVTDGSGSYFLTGLAAGDYKVHFSPPAGSGLVSEYYDDQKDGAGAQIITLTVGAARGGVDATLDAEPVLTGGIAGRVTAHRSRPVGAVDVEALDARGTVVATTAVAPDGSYGLGGLPPGSYVVHFVPAPGNRLRAEYWDRAKTFNRATPINVVAAQTHAGIDAELKP